jgi:predicted RecB family nuclease
MGSVDATTMWKKQRVEECKWNPSCSSHDKPTKKLFHGVQGINSNTGRHLSEEVRPVCMQFVQGD